MAVLGGSAADRIAHCLTIGAINFGSGWFPTLRKQRGASGATTIARGVRRRFAGDGPWRPAELERIEPAEIAAVTGQEPDHPLLALYAESLRDLGARVSAAGGWEQVVAGAGGRAEALAERLGEWRCFADRSRYGELELPFLKRAQLAAAELERCRAAAFEDIARLTLFADNLVPHVLRVEGALRYDAGLLARIEAGEQIPHDSDEEIEIRACALHAVERLVDLGAGRCAAELDALLWTRGQQPRFKALPRHRTRCTAY
jgi:hypothetical protein